LRCPEKQAIVRFLNSSAPGKSDKFTAHSHIEKINRIGQVYGGLIVVD